MRMVHLASLAVLLLVLQAACASVGDPQIQTDHPYYQGELAYSTPARIVQSAYNTARPSTGNAERDKILKLFYWRIEHMFHQQSPAEWNIPGLTPDSSADQQLNICYDSLSLQFSYGHALCGTNHGTLRPILEAAGFGTRRRGIVGDTAHEIQYDSDGNGSKDRWALFNTDSVSVLWMTNSVSAQFAGVNDVIANRNIMLNNPLNIPQYTFGNVSTRSPEGTHSADWFYYYDDGFDLPVANSWVMYAEGYQARPIVYRLKKGESFTRWKDRNGLPSYLGDSGGYRYWGYKGAGGVYRNWSHVGLAPALPTPPTSNALADSRYGNGLFEWHPTLSAGDHLEGAVAQDSNVTFGSASPRLKTTGGSGKIVFEHFSPYVIAGKPADGVDTVKPGATGGCWIAAAVTGNVPVEVSVNHGATWLNAGTLTPANGNLDLTDLVKGRYSYRLRLTLTASNGVDDLQLKTAVMLAEAVFPELKANGCAVTYAAGHSNAHEQIIDFTSQASADHFKVSDSGNVTFAPLSPSNSYAYTSTNNQPCHLVYRVKAPNGKKLKRIHAAADASVRVPPSGNPYARLHLSTNGGSSFTQFASYDAPPDNELSHGWVYGSADVSSANTDEVLVKVQWYNGGYTARLRFVRLYGEYEAGADADLVITHAWDDSSAANRTHNHTIPSGNASAGYNVPTAGSPVHKSVKFAVAATPSVTPPQIVAPASLDDAVAGVPFGATFTATGSQPITWSTIGALPPGISLNASTGLYSGTPTQSGSFNFTIVATNAHGSDSKPYTHQVNATVTVTLQPGAGGYDGVEDTYVDQFAPTSDFGNIERMEVRWYDSGGGLAEHNQALLRFDLSSIPSDAVITGATLTLFNTRANSDNGDIITLNKVTSNWDEHHTWNDGVPASVASGVACPPVSGYSGAPPTPEPYVIADLEALVQGWVTSPSSNKGMLFSCGSNLNFRWASSEYADSLYRPKLEIAYSYPGANQAPALTSGPWATPNPVTLK